MSRPRAAILMYHRASEAFAQAEEGDYALPTALFEAQMRLLKAAGRSVVPLAALTEASYPDRSIVLTFDDGCDTDATVAAPLLRALGFPAAFFVNPALVGQQGRVSWAQLRSAATDGFLIGSHGLDHTLLDQLPAPELERQIVDSKRWLEDRLERPVDALALPGGSGGERARRVAQAAGYRLVLGSRPGTVQGPAGQGILPRFAIRRGHDLPRFSAVADQRPLVLLGQSCRYHAAHSLRSLLGARVYGRLRRLIIERSARTRSS